MGAGHTSRLLRSSSSRIVEMVTACSRLTRCSSTFFRRVVLWQVVLSSQDMLRNHASVQGESQYNDSSELAAQHFDRRPCLPVSLISDVCPVGTWLLSALPCHDAAMMCMDSQKCFLVHPEFMASQSAEHSNDAQDMTVPAIPRWRQSLCSVPLLQTDSTLQIRALDRCFDTVLATHCRKSECDQCSCASKHSIPGEEVRECATLDEHL
jgi:hypothetical protein